MSEKAKIVRLINGEETTVYENTAEASEVIFDMVCSNDMITFRSSPIDEKGEITIECT